MWVAAIVSLAMLPAPVIAARIVSKSLTWVEYLVCVVSFLIGGYGFMSVGLQAYGLTS
jgi:hypothetical protein